MRYLILLALIGNLTLAADRPTQQQLREAVAASQAKHAKENPPLTQDEKLALLEQEIKDAERSKPPRDVKTRADVAKFMKERRKRIDDARKEYFDAKKSYTPEEAKPRLAKMDWDNLAPGVVGHVGPDLHGPRNKVLGGQVRVNQILGPDQFLGEYTYPSERQASKGSVTTTLIAYWEPYDVTCNPVLFTKIPTKGLQEQKTTDVDFNAVVVGQFTYTNVVGGSVTVPVLEKFDPDKVDSWK